MKKFRISQYSVRNSFTKEPAQPRIDGLSKAKLRLNARLTKLVFNKTINVPQNETATYPVLNQNDSKESFDPTRTQPELNTDLANELVNRSISAEVPSVEKPLRLS